MARRGRVRPRRFQTSVGISPRIDGCRRSTIGAREDAHVPKLKTGNELVMKLDVSVQVESDIIQGFQQELMQVLRDLNLGEAVKIEIE